MALTKKQKEVLDYIYDYSNTHGYAPTQTEIMEHFRLKSLGSVQRYLKYLSNDGYINLEPNARRGIEVLPLSLNFYSTPGATQPQNISSSVDQPMQASRLREVPLMGKVAAGLPIESVKHFEFVDVPEGFLRNGRQYFALQVSGDSMIEDGIHDQDTIVVQQLSTATRGETVVAMVGQEATVKKYFPFKDRVELHPANSSMEPIVIENERKGEFRIIGKLAALLRSYD